MLEAAWTHSVELERLSFKGTVDTLRQWTPLFAPPDVRFHTCTPMKRGASSPQILSRCAQTVQSRELGLYAQSCFSSSLSIVISGSFHSRAH